MGDSCIFVCARKLSSWFARCTTRTRRNQGLTEDEIVEAEEWIDGQFRMNSLKEELAALTLPESISAANRWFSRNTDNPAAMAIALQLLPAFKTLRKMLRGKGLLG